jgi:hypothetical protein
VLGNSPGGGGGWPIGMSPYGSPQDSFLATMYQLQQAKQQQQHNSHSGAGVVGGGGMQHGWPASGAGSAPVQPPWAMQGFPPRAPPQHHLSQSEGAMNNNNHAHRPPASASKAHGRHKQVMIEAYNLRVWARAGKHLSTCCFFLFSIA